MDQSTDSPNTSTTADATVDSAAGATDHSVASLREDMIKELHALGALRTTEVEAAVRAVPRHLFIPEDTPEQAYEAERAPVTKRDEQGVALSSVSAARIQAFMLEQAAIQPGMRVLEVGSGGYNAALIAELVGDAGQVTSMDIDPDVVARARRLLDEAGYRQVRTVVDDGALGVPGDAPFDRILVTVEASDISPAWVDQLAPDGRIVVPLRLRGLTRSVAFDHRGDHLVSDGYDLCGFVPMQGAGSDPYQLLVLHDDGDDQVALRIDGDPVASGDPLRDAFATASTSCWSGVTVASGHAFDDLDLCLASAINDFAVLRATRSAREAGLVASWSMIGISTEIDDSGSFAYVTLRPTDTDKTLYEFGAVGHGPHAEALAKRLADRIATWDRDYRDSRATFTAWPSGTADSALPIGRVVDRANYRFTISWPQPQR